MGTLADENVNRNKWSNRSIDQSLHPSINQTQSFKLLILAHRQTIKREWIKNQMQKSIWDSSCEMKREISSFMQPQKSQHEVNKSHSLLDTAKENTLIKLTFFSSPVDDDAFMRC